MFFSDLLLLSPDINELDDDSHELFSFTPFKDGECPLPDDEYFDDCYGLAGESFLGLEEFSSSGIFPVIS